ncbi:hypothetical protein JTE90_001863 [Oedothorax gibbosus]|uniref:Uncharacterized protein n=1 Tax=Oedothorax gibbosus TaxID=931172 RepID=A0AAV6VNH6_9ARAC|nr:hypothetical protein JTE90_001863 [Oedothorax gibbosus]
MEPTSRKLEFEMTLNDFMMLGALVGRPSRMDPILLREQLPAELGCQRWRRGFSLATQDGDLELPKGLRIE